MFYAPSFSNEKSGGERIATGVSAHAMTVLLGHALVDFCQFFENLNMLGAGLHAGTAADALICLMAFQRLVVSASLHPVAVQLQLICN